jgi:type IV pilus assembly protein PilV
MSANRGFTLLEVLFATLLLALGMLALNALQLRSYSLTRDIQLRSTVAWLAHGLAEAMRANPLRTVDAEGTLHNDWSHYESAQSPDAPSPVSCASLSGPESSAQAGCDAATLAVYDLHQFRRQLHKQFPRADDVAAAVCRSSDLSQPLQLDNLHCTSTGVLAIKVVWRTRPRPMQGSPSASKTTNAASLASFQLRVEP